MHGNSLLHEFTQCVIVAADVYVHIGWEVGRKVESRPTSDIMQCSKCRIALFTAVYSSTVALLMFSSWSNLYCSLDRGTLASKFLRLRLWSIELKGLK